MRKDKTPSRTSPQGSKRGCCVKTILIQQSAVMEVYTLKE